MTSTGTAQLSSPTWTDWRVREPAGRYQENVGIRFSSDNFRVVTAKHLVVELVEDIRVARHLQLAVALPAGGGDGHGHPVVGQVVHKPLHSGLEAGRGQEGPDLLVHLCQELERGEGQAALLHYQPGGVHRLFARSSGLQLPAEEILAAVPRNHLSTQSSVQSSKYRVQSTS